MYTCHKEAPQRREHTCRRRETGFSESWMSHEIAKKTRVKEMKMALLLCTGYGQNNIAVRSDLNGIGGKVKKKVDSAGVNRTSEVMRTYTMDFMNVVIVSGVCIGISRSVVIVRISVGISISSSVVIVVIEVSLGDVSKQVSE